MSGHMNVGVIMHMTGIAMIQKLGSNKFITTSEINVRSENVHNVGMVMFDRPHVVEVHALKKVSVKFLQRKERSSRSIR
jgi:hypothetical protein